MKLVTEYPDGLFNWVDLTTSDMEASKRFYTALMGWEAVDMPTDMGSIYTMFKINGHNAAGMGPMSPDMLATGTPSHWSAYVKHSDVDSVAEKAAKAGGNVLFPPFDVMQEGRMTMIQDPTGAVFGVWQPINHIGAEVVNHPNAFVWSELQTADLEPAQAFYTAVFGWEGKADDTGYVTLSNNGRMQAGMLKMDPSEGIPPNWSVYFMSADLDAQMKHAQELGGQILVGPFPVGEMGRVAIIQDPVGAVFTLMGFSDPSVVDPPPGH